MTLCVSVSQAKINILCLDCVVGVDDILELRCGNVLMTYVANGVQRSLMRCVVVRRCGGGRRERAPVVVRRPLMRCVWWCAGLEVDAVNERLWWCDVR